MTDTTSTATDASSNKRPLSPSPADGQDGASKRQNTGAEADEDITADDKPLAGKVPVEDVSMKDEGMSAAYVASLASSQDQTPGLLPARVSTNRIVYLSSLQLAPLLPLLPASRLLRRLRRWRPPSSPRPRPR